MNARFFKPFFFIVLTSLVLVVKTNAQLLTNLHVFTGPDGYHPSGGLLLLNGTFYGTARGLGTQNFGTVFAINTNGNGFGVIHTFSTNTVQGFPSQMIPDGNGPLTGLANSGNVLFGTTVGGGANGVGTIYRLNLDGTGFSILHSFAEGDYDHTDENALTNADGQFPAATLKVVGGKIYGTAAYGGTNGSGTIFSLNLDGSGFSTLHTFAHLNSANQTARAGNNADGGYPFSTVTIANGVIYGTTYEGGSQSFGTIYRLNVDGSNFTNLLMFTNSSQGEYPVAGLALDGDTLYGVTSGLGDIIVDSYGTLFKIKTNGTDFAILYTFGTNTTLAFPGADLLLTNNVLYGSVGGAAGYPVEVNGIFSIHTDGSHYLTLYRFSEDNGAGDGSSPISSLVFANNALYGQALGPIGGKIFRVSLHPQFFNNEASVSESNSIYYLSFSNNFFGFYSYQSYPFLYHFDLGFEYFLDANDANRGAYFYDFTSGHFWYTNPQNFPYIYDFTLNSWLYYFPDTQNAGHYTSNPRYFYNYATSQILTQ